MTTRVLVALLVWGASSGFLWSAPPEGTVILQDDFNRAEADPEAEQVGNGWRTNSKVHANGIKQVDLADGAVFLKKPEGVTHPVSLQHPVDFQDGIIRLKVKLSKGDNLTIDLGDPKEKSVHAGHLCLAHLWVNKAELVDQKLGRMENGIYERKKSGEQTDADRQQIERTTAKFKTDMPADQWHDVEFQIVGDQMALSINGQPVGQFSSPGVSHPVKSILRLGANKTAWLDDVEVIRLK